VLDGVLYAVGGHDGPLVRKSIECYQPQTGVWTTTADMHTCRRNAGTTTRITATYTTITCSTTTTQCFEKKQFLHCLSLFLPNCDRFSKLFHW